MPVTTIGKEFEYFIEDQLDLNGYNYESQVQASGINESWSEIDIVITYDESDTAEAVSLKYQGGPGSAEEKIPANVRIISYDDFVRQYLTVRDIAINYAIN